MTHLDPAWLWLIATVLLLVVVAVVIAIFRKPEAGLVLTLALFPVQKTFDLPVVGPKLTAAEAVFFIALVGLCSAILLQKRLATIPRGGLVLPAFCFVLAGVASLLNTTTTTSLLVGAFEVATFGYLLFFYCWMTVFLTDERRLNVVMGAWWVATAVVVVFGLVGAVALASGRGGSSPFVFAGLRVTSTFRNPNAMASYLVTVFFIFLGLAHGGWYENKICRAATWCLVALVGAVCMVSTSRAAYVGLAAGGLFYAWATRRFLRVLLAGAAVASLGAFVVFNLVSQKWEHYALERASTLLAVSDYAEEERGRQLYTSLDLIKLHPVIGVGIGTQYKYAEDKGLRALRSHNTLLTAWVETGTLGLALALWIVAAASGIAWGNVKHSNDRRWKMFNIGLLSGLIAVGVFGIFHDAARHRHLWLTLAIATAVSLQIRPRPAEARGEPSSQSCAA